MSNKYNISHIKLLKMTDEKLLRLIDSACTSNYDTKDCPNCIVLKDDLVELIKSYEELQRRKSKVIERNKLYSDWNKLKEYLNEKNKKFYDTYGCANAFFRHVLDKMEELEKGNSNE